MKNRKKTKQQRGFFDLGLSMAILTLSGALTYTVAPEQNDNLAAQDPQTEIVAEVNTDTGETHF